MVENNENEEYKFVIAILAGTISLLYTLFNYIQNTAINKFEYVSLCVLISLALIILIGFFIYFIFKGFSMELKDENHEKFKNIASKIYLINFFIGTILLIVLITYLLIINIPQIYNISSGIYLLIVFTAILSIYILSAFILLSNSNYFISKLKILSIGIPVILLSVLGVFFLFFVVISITSNYHQGNIEFDMDKIFYKNDNQIPVLIKITGPDTSFTVILFNEKSNDLIEIWNITNLGPNYFTDSKQNNFISNDNVVVSLLGNGKYNIFINTTNLTTGYYQIKFSRQDFNKDSYESGFYLLDYKNESLNRINIKDELNLTI